MVPIFPPQPTHEDSQIENRRWILPSRRCRHGRIHVPSRRRPKTQRQKCSLSLPLLRYLLPLSHPYPQTHIGITDLAPTAPYPRQLQQAALLLTHALHTLHIPPQNIILTGDSAGANLVLSLLSHISHPHPSTVLPIPRISLSSPL